MRKAGFRDEPEDLADEPPSGDPTSSPDGGQSATVKDLLPEIRDLLWTSDSREAAMTALERIGELRHRRKASTKRLKLNALKTLAHWRLSGEIVPDYENVNEARIQMWEIELFCPDFAFQREFVRRIVQDYPNARGPAQLLTVYESIESVVPTPLFAPEDGVVVIRRPGATRTFMAFSGLKLLVSSMTPYLLDRAIAQPLNANFIACFDMSRRHYLGGIRPIGDRAATVAHLRSLMDEFRDTRITAVGGSSGVFGALHASCDLGIEHVIATSGPTSLDIGFEDEDRQVYKKIQDAAAAGEIELVDLFPLISRSKIKRVDFFVGGQNEFDMAQMNALRDNSDVVVPHIYEDTDVHNVIERAIADGSYMKAATAL